MATQWKIDPVHSEILFKVKHLMITTITGSFDKFDVSVETEEEDFMKAKINFTADVNSISTGVVDRDAHLKSADFFDAAKYPSLTFKSKSFQKVEGKKYKLLGDLTMHGVTKPV